jgi:hypothetical protein
VLSGTAASLFVLSWYWVISSDRVKIGEQAAERIPIKRTTRDSPSSSVLRRFGRCSLVFRPSIIGHSQASASCLQFWHVVWGAAPHLRFLLRHCGFASLR